MQSAYGKVYGSYKNGEDIYKDKKGFYIIQWNMKEKKEVKKHLKSLAARRESVKELDPSPFS